MSEAASQPDVKILSLEPEPVGDPEPVAKPGGKPEWEPFSGLVLVFESFGVKMWVGTNRREAAARLHTVLPPGWKDCQPEDVEDNKLGLLGEKQGTYGIDLANTPITTGMPLDLALEILDSTIRERIAFSAPDHIFVHAGVVAHQGRAIVIPGKSFSGKTTLVAALVRAGATYYSDEFAPIDRDGLVHPYAKPLSIRGANQLQNNHHVETLGGAAGDEPLPVGLVVLPTYRAGASWEPTRLSPAQGALAMIGHTAPARERPQQMVPTLTRAVESATILQGDRGEADELAPLLLAELEAQQT